MSEGTASAGTVEVKSEKRGAGVVTGLILGAILVMVGIAVANKMSKPAVDTATVQKIEALQAEVSALNKFKKDCDIAVPFIGQKVDGVAGAHDKLVSDLRMVIVQQSADVAVMARALSNMVGRDQWIAMVSKARADMEAEAKSAQAAQAPAQAPVPAAVEAPAKPEVEVKEEVKKEEPKAEKKGKK